MKYYYYNLLQYLGVVVLPPEQAAVLLSVSELRATAAEDTGRA